MAIFDELVAAWQKVGASANDSAATQESLDALRTRAGVKLPRFFESYLLTVNGMPEGECDEEVIYFWSAEEIIKSDLWAARNDSVEIPFADYLIHSHLYLLCVGNDGTDRGVIVESYSLDFNARPLIALTFEQFLAMYIADPPAIAYGW